MRFFYCCHEIFIIIAFALNLICFTWSVLFRWSFTCWSRNFCNLMLVKKIITNIWWNFTHHRDVCYYQLPLENFLQYNDRSQRPPSQISLPSQSFSSHINFLSTLARYISMRTQSFHLYVQKMRVKNLNLIFLKISFTSYLYLSPNNWLILD